MNCLTCMAHVPMKVYHAHMAYHDAVRIGNSPEHVEATKDIVKADDLRVEDHIKNAKPS